jgi:type II secretion system protein G
MQKMKILKPIVVVIGILVVLFFLSMIVAVNFNGHRKPMLGATRASIASVQVALDVYAQDLDRYPDPDVGLGVLVTNPGISAWGGPYLKHVPVDAWGQEIRYSLVDGRPNLRSGGPDMKFGTEDDITN